MGRAPNLTDTDPEKFKVWLAAELAALEVEGVTCCRRPAGCHRRSTGKG